MKCQDCGHDYPVTLPRCRNCGRLNPRRTRTQTESRLIEFPVQPRVNPEPKPNPAQLPPWRAELSAKVRAVRARKSAERAAGVNHTPKRPVESDEERALPEQSRPQPPVGSNHIVEAALNRVRRAHENPRRQRPAGIGSLAPAVQPALIEIDEETTDEIIDREPWIAKARHSPPPVDPPTTTVASSPIATPTLPQYQSPRAATPLPVEYPESSFSALETEPEMTPTMLVETDPLDYLAAEVRKVDAALGPELKRHQSAPLISHMVIWLVDVLTIGIASTPFLLSIAATGGNFAGSNTRLAAGLIVTLVALFYLALTQSLSGKTFGMMLTNTRVVDAANFKPLSTKRALLRSICCFITAAPAGLGLLWTIVDPKNRGLHDLLSRSVVIIDY